MEDQINQKLEDHPIFICGHPKSGTSLLRNLLDNHPQVVVYPEDSLFFRRFLPAVNGKSTLEKLALADELLINFFTWNKENPPPSQDGYPNRDYSEISFESIRQHMQTRVEKLHRHDGDILGAAILAYGEVSCQTDRDIRWWVEKTPFNENYAVQIYDWWPDARCIHLLRDPRDNFSSLKKEKLDWTPKEFAWNWVRSTQLGIDNLKQYGPERYKLLSYEEFVRAPMGSVDNLCSYLEIENSARLHTPTRAGKALSDNTRSDNRFSQISPAEVGQWKNNLSTEEVLLIEAIAGRLMRQLKYLPSRFRLFSLPFSRQPSVLRERFVAQVKQIGKAKLPPSRPDRQYPLQIGK